MMKCMMSELGNGYALVFLFVISLLACAWCQASASAAMVRRIQYLQYGSPLV